MDRSLVADLRANTTAVALVCADLHLPGALGYRQQVQSHAACPQATLTAIAEARLDVPWLTLDPILQNARRLCNDNGGLVGRQLLAQNALDLSQVQGVDLRYPPDAERPAERRDVHR